MTKNTNKFKTGVLSSQEKTIIDRLVEKGEDVKSVANILNRKEGIVQKYLDGKTPNEPADVSVIEDESSQPNRFTVKDMMVDRTEEKRTKSIVMMTEGASQRLDAVSKRYRGRANRYTGGNVYRISDGSLIERGDLISEQKTGPLDDDEMRIMMEMLKQNKSAKQIAVALNRDEKEIQKWIEE